MSISKQILKLTRNQLEAVQRLELQGYDRALLEESLKLIHHVYSGLYGADIEEIAYGLRTMSDTLTASRKNRVALEKSRAAEQEAKTIARQLKSQLISAAKGLIATQRTVETLETTAVREQEAQRKAQANSQAEIASAREELEKSKERTRNFRDQLAEVKGTGVTVEALQGLQRDLQRLTLEAEQERQAKNAAHKLLLETRQQLQALQVIQAKVSDLSSKLGQARSFASASEQRIVELKEYLVEERNSKAALLDRITDAVHQDRHELFALPARLMTIVTEMLKVQPAQASQLADILSVQDRQARISALEDRIRSIEHPPGIEQTRTDQLSARVEELLEHLLKSHQQLGRLSAVEADNARLRVETAKLRTELKLREQQEIVRWQMLAGMPEKVLREYLDHEQE